MKILTYLLASLMLLSACKKTKDTAAAPKEPDYQGNYKGAITLSVNGAFSQTIHNCTIVIVNNGNRENLTMVNNLVQSFAVSLKGTNWELPKAIAVSATDYNLVEYGSGTFTGDTMTVELHQDEVNPADNILLKSKKWTGVLYKQ